MTVTTTANRIVNCCVVFMICACLALWATDIYVLNTKPPSSIRNSKNSADKSAATMNNDLAQAKVERGTKIEHAKHETTAGLNAAQKTAKALSWLAEASLNDPDIRKLNMYYDRKRIDEYYLDLYKILRLDDATGENLRDLLAERYSEGRRFTLNSHMTSPDTSPSDYIKEKERIKSGYDEKIAMLLGPDNYALFQEYETTIPERSEITRFRKELEFSSEPLTVEQETALLPAIGKYLESDPYLSNMTKAGVRINPTSASNTVNISEEKLVSLKEVLSSGQIDTLKSLQKRLNGLRSVNYSWGAMGDQTRRPGKQ